MSIVLDTKDFRDITDVKGKMQVGSLGDAGSTILGSGSSNATGSSGNVGSANNVGSLNNVANNVNAASSGVLSLGSVGIGSIGNVEAKALVNSGEAAKIITAGVVAAEITVEAKTEPTVYRQYKYRFIILLLYFLISNAGAVTGSPTAPLITNLTKIYGVSFATVNLASLIGMIVYIPATIPGNYVLDVWGVKPGLLIGTTLMVGGNWIRVLAGHSFSWVLVGQLVSALGGPMLSNCPQKISAQWIAPKGRTMFTTLLMLSGTLGGAIGYLMPAAIVGEESSPDLGKALFVKMLLYQAIICSGMCIPIYFLYKEKPATPPSPSASMKRENFKQGIKTLFKNKNFLWLLGQQAAILGCINALATVLQSLVDPFGINQLQASSLSTIMLISCVVGSLIFSTYVTKYKKFRVPLIFSSIAGLAGYGMFLGLLYTESFAGLACTVFIIGFVMAPSGPLALEFACELTFPVGEAMSGGVILCVLQISCTALSFGMSGIMGMDDKKKAAIWCLVSIMAVMVLGSLCSFFIKEEFKRSDVDKKHADDEKERQDAAANPETPCVLINDPDNSPDRKTPADQAKVSE